MDGVNIIYKALGKANKTAHMLANNTSTQTLYTNAAQDYTRDPISDHIDNISNNISPDILNKIKNYNQEDNDDRH